VGKSKHKHNQASFRLEGRFLSLLVKDGYKIEQLCLATSEGERWIKLSKESRASLGRVLTPGEWIQVLGQKKLDSKTGELKLRADQIVHTLPNPAKALQQPEAKPPAKANILVCQKSDCCKRGSQGVCQALETALRDRGLEDQVSIKRTGCMDKCKAGPNIVFTPDKTRYSRVHPEEVAALVEKHFPSETNLQENRTKPSSVS
jgi:(2Fe-2S) ferredoxin